MVKLLWLTERFPPDIGGVARSAERIVRSLTALDIEVDVVTWSRYLDGGETLPPKASPSGDPRLRVYRLGLYRHWDTTLPHTLNLLDWLHRHQPYGAVWGHYLFPAGFVAVWFARLKDLPSLVSVRGNDMDRGIFPPGDFSRLQWTLAHATQITTVSQEMAHKVTTLCQRPAVVLPNVVNTQIFRPVQSVTSQDAITLKQTLGIQPDEVVLGFSGELREKKGQRFLFQALSEVRAVRAACLLIIGELRPETETLLHRYGTFHPEDMARVIVTGPLDSPAQVAEHLRLCDVYLQPSLWDGMPNGLLEAMACGCACIGSDAGGIPEVIDHGKTGFVLPRAQLHHLGQAVLEYLALESSVQESIQARGHASILQSHSLAQEQGLLQPLMEQLFASEPTG